MAKRHLTPDDEMGRLLEHRLQQDAVPAGEVCADAETLASYVDDGMSAAERADWEAHFATCAKCRRSLALMSRLKETASPEWEGEAARGESSSGGNLWVWMPLAACILVGAGLYFATRPAERAVSLNNTAASAPSASPVLQEARGEPAPAAPAAAPLAPATPPPASRAAETPAKPASDLDDVRPAATPQRRLNDLKERTARKDDASRREKAADAGATAPAPPAVAEEVITTTAQTKTKAAVADEFAKAESFRQQQQPPPAQNAQARQFTSGPRESQQATGTLASAAPAGNVGGANAANSPNAAGAGNTANAVNARPSGPVNTANAAAPAPAAAAAANAPTAAAAAPAAQGQVTARERGERDTAAVAGPMFKSSLSVDAKRNAERQGLLGTIADPLQPARQWRIFKFGHIEVTRDGGGSWINEVLQTDTAYLAMASPAPGVGWIVGSKGTVWRLGLDVGAKNVADKSIGAELHERKASAADAWQARRVPTQEDLVSVTAIDAQQAVVVTRSGLRFATSDGGKSWTRR